MDTQKIKIFIKKHFPTNVFENIQLSELSRTLLEKIIHQIHLGEKAWKSEKGVRAEDLSALPEGLDYGYIVEEIREEIEKLSKIGRKYTFVIKEKLITIYAVYPYRTRSLSPENKHKILRDLDASVKKMYIWLYVAVSFSSAKCSRELMVYWYLTDHKKELPDEISGELIDREHANTAFTQACPVGANRIYIYRKEEWFKVFIHETFHSFGMDFATMPEKDTNAALFSIFPVSCDFRFYEAYTETWAEILNVLFLSICETADKSFYRLETCLEEERIFSLFQAVKILRHQKIKYQDLLTTSGGSRYREKTQAFSYYILRSIFMFSVNDFIEWCAKKNKGTIVFKKTPNNLMSLVDFIKTNHREPVYLQSIEEIERWFSKSRSDKGFEIDTLRMSVYG
jgi:hypothetical protein